MQNNDKYGILLTPDIKIFRKQFDEMTHLLGIQVIYYPTKATSYTTYTEIMSSDCAPIKVGCIFEEHPQQVTLKKMGWISELQENASIIHVPYDLENLQQGSLFIIPSGLDKAEGRLFRVSRLSNGIIYPASITCEIVPEYENTYAPTQSNFKHSSFNLLSEEGDN